ncbi:MAG: hypothetical protein L0H79_18255 [Intrasporangium sp.]|uniref:hypothetical protein n=1 Tax=Intrasporangium sp. TaxID=1925024 RepID=UPI0026487595|nr:hypothetical protein [Intrasporangium sp.]MDN5797670.1 hypothetical protein [Intrasporangium sp.]
MGWLSRATKKTSGGDSMGPPVPVPPPAAQATAPPVAGTGGSAETPGHRGPVVTVTSFEQAPTELTWQLPVVGELYRLMAGPDRSDYSVMVLERPIHFYPPEGFDVERVPGDRRVPDRRGRPMVRVRALVVCSRFVGQQLHPGMRDLAVNIAYVIDERVLSDQSLDLSTIEYAATGLLSEGRVGTEQQGADKTEREGAHQPEPPVQRVPEGPAAEPATQSATTVEPATEAPGTVVTEALAAELAVDVPAAPGEPGPSRATGDWILGEAARVLCEGVEAERGRSVERLTARLTLDAEGGIVGLAGNADGTAPVPTRETWGRLRALLGGLPAVSDAPIETLSVSVADGHLSWEAGRRS